MANITGQNIEYQYNSARLVGFLCGENSGLGPATRPGVVLVHDAFGVSEYMRQKARRVAGLGYAVLAADVWGDGKELREESEIGPMIGRFAQDRTSWMGRLQSARNLLAAQPGVDSSNIAFAGYCFGGASVLEYSRTIGGIQGAISIHGGLNLVDGDWSAAAAGGKVLILTGFEDPMADSKVLLQLQNSLTSAGVDWEVNTYGHTKHGFTRPDSDRANKRDVISYNAQSDERSWFAMSRFLEEIFA
jgi:dienelactone hydrolase